MKRRERHGLRDTEEYNIWANIVQRCTNPKNPSFRRYGAVGRDISDIWRASFLAFIDHVGPRPSKHHSIDRIDNDRGYHPGNIRWATREEQAQNQARTIFITSFGETHCLSEWAKMKKIPIVTLYCRIIMGWTPERALTAPRTGTSKLSDEQVRQLRLRAAGGETGKALAEELGISTSAACRAIKGKTYAAIAAEEREP